MCDEFTDVLHCALERQRCWLSEMTEAMATSIETDKTNILKFRLYLKDLMMIHRKTMLKQYEPSMATVIIGEFDLIRCSILKKHR
jgi:hypothetical protein